jgi:WD40 repeat protein
MWFVSRRTNITSGKQFKADEHPIYSLSLSADGNFLTTLSDERRVRVWNLDQVFHNLLPLPTLPLFEYTFLEGTSPVAAVLSEDGKRLAVAPVGTKIVVFNVTTHQPLVELDTDDFDAGYIGLGANAIALSADGRYLAYTLGARYYLYDIDQKKHVITFNRAQLRLSQVFSPGQSFVGYGGFVSDYPLVVYGIRSGGRMNVKFPRAYEEDEPVSFSDDGNYFVTRGPDSYIVWQLPTDYLQGTLSWPQLQDELKARCLQIVPVKQMQGQRPLSDSQVPGKRLIGPK